jgi:hypothetical protein
LAYPPAVKALDAGDQRAALPLAAYKKLYEIEAEIRDHAEAARLSIRQERSKPIFDELVAWGETHQRYEPSTSKLGEAIRYLLNHRVALGRFLESGLKAQPVQRQLGQAAIDLIDGAGAGAQRPAPSADGRGSLINMVA